MRVESEQIERAFELFLLTVIGVQLFLAPRYRPRSQLFIWSIGIPTLLLILGHLSVQSSHRLQVIANTYFQTEDMFRDVMEEGEELVGQEESKISRIEAAKMFLWIIGFFVAIILFGVIPGAIVFMISYFKMYAGESWRTTVIYSTLIGIGIILVFNVVISAPFPEGLLFRVA